MAGRHRKIGRKTVALGVMIAGLLAAGIAFAAWTATGTGSGYARATSAQALTTVDVSATTAATLYPGATGDVELSISNPNIYPVQVTDVTGNGAISTAAVGCDASVVTTLDPDTGVRDFPTLSVIKRYRGVADRELLFGVYASVIEPGTVRRGDELTLL